MDEDLPLGGSLQLTEGNGLTSNGLDIQFRDAGAARIPLWAVLPTRV